MGSLTLVILNPRSRAAQRRWPRFETKLRAALGPFELEQTRSRSQSYFANVASFGLGGLVDELVNRSSKALFFGGGMQVALDAEFDDENLDPLVIPDRSNRVASGCAHAVRG